MEKSTTTYLLALSRPPTCDELSLIKKLLLSAQTSTRQTKVCLAEVWERYEVRVIFPMGREAASKILGLKRSQKLDDLLFDPVRVANGVVIPLPSPTTLLKGPLSQIDQVVRTLVRARKSVEGERSAPP